MLLKYLTGLRLLLISLAIAIYFLALYLSYIYGIEEKYSIIGFFRELLTIPFLLAQVFFLVIGVMMLWNRIDRKDAYLLVISILILLASSIFTFGSFL